MSSRVIVRTARSRRAVGTAAVVGLLVLAAGCSSGSSGSTAGVQSGSTTPNIPGTAKITALTVPATVACGGKTSTTVPVQYATTGAAKLVLLIDGRDLPPTTAASATVNVQLHCDALPHTVVLVAYDGQGHRTVEQQMVNTQL